MSIKIDPIIRDELIQIKEWISSRDEKWIYDHQEFIVALIRLLTNHEFRNKINALRKKYNIPREWYSKGKFQNIRMDNEKILRWLSKNPSIPSDMEMYEISEQCKIDTRKYWAFIQNYLCSGRVISLMPYSYVAKNEFKYKAHIELDFGENDEDFGVNPEKKIYLKKASVVFYKDTTINQLVEFIKENRKEISDIQRKLSTYSHPQKYGYFKREIFIYLLYLLGEKPAEIIKKIATDFKSDISRQYINHIVKSIKSNQ